jgi:hypothetical protein
MKNKEKTFYRISIKSEDKTFFRGFFEKKKKLQLKEMIYNTIIGKKKIFKNLYWFQYNFYFEIDIIKTKKIP